MKMLRHSHVIAALTLALSVLAACTGTEPSRFYVLTSLSDQSAEPAMSTIRNGVALGVGPVVLPKYLDRPQIVTRTSKNELHFAEFDQWGGRFGDNFTRVLAENLSLLLSTDRVSVYPWKASAPVDYQITVEVIHFEGYAAGRTDLAARWSVISGDGREVFLMTKSSFSELARRSAASPEGGQDYEPFVAAMSRALGNLSRDIAAAVLAVSQP